MKLSRAATAGWSLCIVGALVLSIPAQLLRIDSKGWGDCSVLPSISEGLVLVSLFGLAVALLWSGWTRLLKASRHITPGNAMVMAAVVHVVAIFAPPFLSQDSLCYAAVGKIIAAYGGSPYVPLNQTMRSDDPFFVALNPSWQNVPSAYWPGFDAVARTVQLCAGDSLIANLRLFQVAAGASILGTAWLASLSMPPERRGWTVTLVGMCPLSIIEATVNAHNDAYMALAVAAWSLAVTRGHLVGGLAALLLGVSVKASGLLILAFAAAEATARYLNRWVSWITPRLVLILAPIGVSVFLVGFLLAREHITALVQIGALLGDATEKLPHCTRSIECLPRYIFAILGMPGAAFVIGLAARAVGGTWLLYSAVLCASKPERAQGLEDEGPDARSWTVLQGAATAMGIYWLMLHGFNQSWYLLSVMPLLPHATPRMLAVLKLYMLTSTFYYITRVALWCDKGVLITGIREVTEGIFVLAPPLYKLYKMRHMSNRAIALQGEDDLL